MKNKFIIILCTLALFSSSCKKGFLDRKPLDQYSESSLWTSANDAQAALNGCYSGWESGDWIFYMDCASDNALDPFPWESFFVFRNMGLLLTPTNTGSSKWNFNTIQKCNWFLANIDKTPMEEDLKKRMKGEARFLRAYKYFIISQLYGDVPLITNNISTEQANTLRRSPKDSVIQFVLTELDTAQANLPDSYSGSDIGRITKGAAWALKARVELYNQKYENCLASCNNVMGKYSLFNSYADIFRIQNEHNSEIILDVEYIENDVPLFLGVMPTLSSGGWWTIDPVRDLVDAYEMNNGKIINDPSSGYDPNEPYKNRDPRLQATIIVPGSLYEGSYFDPLNPDGIDYYSGEALYTGYVVRKYVANLSDFPNMWNAGLNIPVIRYAEVLLTYAEAKIELNQIDNTVYDAINQIRVRAGMPVVDQAVYNTQETMRKLVRRERRVELAMEGLRWFDIQRWKIGNDVMSGTVYGSRLGSVDPNTGKLTLSSDRILQEQRVFNEKNYFWPIPQSEIDINKNLVQNPGY